MKKFAIAAIATAMLSTPAVASAADQRTVIRERPNATVVVQRGPGYRDRTVIRHNDRRDYRQAVRSNQRAWQRGQRFDRRYATNYRVVDYRQYSRRGMYAPPRGYQWVRSGNDAVLVSIASGVIGAVLGGVLFN